MAYVIKVENLSKQYHIGALQNQRTRTFREALMDLAAGPWRRLRARRALLGHGSAPESETNTIWALRDVSFEIEAGDVVGIVGRNGSGKSTLLKILSRVTRPTSGRAELHGRVGSLLEVGTGFHSELTGRENIYLNGAILGMTRREIECKFDAIVDFSGIEQFLDTPCKHYSSGMYVRLAFAVASHLETEILIVDEVLAVGDVVFQKKCLAKIGDLTRGGRTVLFVSHNLAIVQNLCQRAIFLSAGQVASVGTCASVLRDYLAATAVAATTDIAAYREPGMQAVIRSIATLNDEGYPAEHFLSGAALTIEIDYDFPPPLTSLNVTLIFESAAGERLFSIQTLTHRGPLDDVPRRGKLRCQVPALPLVQGQYYITFLVDAERIHVDFLERAVGFTVDSVDYFGTGHLPYEHQGRVLVHASWQIQETASAGSPAALAMSAAPQK